MSQGVSVNQLFKSAQDEGLISKASMQALNVVDVGNQIQNNLGIDPIQLNASEVVIVTMMMDDSGSIKFGRNAKNIIDGHNLVIQSLKDSKQENNVLIHTRYLNGTILYPYCSLDQAVKMDSQNYNPYGGTPLYDQEIIILGTVLAKIRECKNNGIPARTITLTVTDGKDEGSVRANPKMVASLVTDMLSMEANIIACMGVKYENTDFKDIFKAMAIQDQWILTPENTEHEIRQAFSLFSRSAVRASKSAANFSQTAQGGFGV